MWALIAIPGTCWLCALLAMPRQPLPGNEVEELVYRRLLGRHQRVALLALLLTVAAFLALIAMLSQRARLSTLTDTAPRQICTDAPTARPTCYTEQGDGSWSVEILEPDGGRTAVMTVLHGPTPEDLASGYSG